MSDIIVEDQFESDAIENVIEENTETFGDDILEALGTRTSKEIKNASYWFEFYNAQKPEDLVRYLTTLFIMHGKYKSTAVKTPEVINKIRKLPYELKQLGFNAPKDPGDIGNFAFSVIRALKIIYAKSMDSKLYKMIDITLHMDVINDPDNPVKFIIEDKYNNATFPVNLPETLISNPRNLKHILVAYVSIVRDNIIKPTDMIVDIPDVKLQASYIKEQLYPAR